ncbi:MAG TPA: PAS domain-containing protein [Granulicella sp.]|nr:PAS domain-containing protein [Granulicella sp.]
MKAQSKVARERELLSAVLTSLPDAVLVLDRDWRLVFANEEARRLSRIRPEDLNSKTHWELFPETVGTQIEQCYRSCMASAAPGHLEYFYAPFDLWVDVTVRPIPDGLVLHYRDDSARKRAEAYRNEKLFLEQRELITFVQQAARIAFWKLDLVASTLIFDVGSYPVFGHPFDALDEIARVRSILHPDDLPRIRAEVQRALQTGELIVLEFRVFDQYDRIIWLEARAQTTTSVDGKAIGLGGIAIDITSRKRNEEALAASEERYRVLTELSPQFLWTGSPHGEVTYANQAFLDYLGFTLADLDQQGWLRAFAVEDRARVVEAWTHSVATGVDYDLEARLLNAHAVPRWWWIRALPLRNEHGAITNWLGVAIDIHDRKVAADTLHQKQRESERQRAEIEAVYRTAPVALALFDPVEFRYLRLNDRQAEIVGLTQDQILGRTLTEIAPIAGLEEMFQQVLEGRPIRNALLQGELPMRPGEHRYWTVNYFPVYNADGTVQAISAATVEITNQKKAENALIQSEKLAAVGRLASSISHEINNPLEAVTNLLFLIAESPGLTAEIRPFVELAQGELQRVCQIATQTLRFHRQAARATLVTAQEIVDAVLNLYQGRLTNSNIRVDARYHTATPILCFENDIRQVLNNLIANAIDAMRQGGSLLIRAHDATEIASNASFGAAARTPFDVPESVTRSALRRGVRITIADTGHGMPPSVRARVFEPFYTTKDLNGTGLGLWISGGIIARHHGRISLRSSDHPDHHGTVFSIFLPHIAEAQIIESNAIPT